LGNLWKKSKKGEKEKRGVGFLEKQKILKKGRKKKEKTGGTGRGRQGWKY